MAKKFLRFALAAAMLAGSASAFAAFKDFAIDLRSTDLVPAEEQVQWGAVKFGVVFNEDGSLTRVDATDAAADMVLSGKYHGADHGWAGITAELPVDGPVKISLGSCQFANGDATVKDADGNTVASFGGSTGSCWNNNDDALAVGFYKGEAGKITVNFGSYVHSFAMRAAAPSELVEEATMTFSLGDIAAEGVAPEAVKTEIGSKVTIPVNRTLFAEGKTLAAWTDGTQQYACGAEVEMPAADVTLTPVFVDNNVALADRKESVTINWDFQRRNGAPLLSYQNATGIYVTQAVVNGETIDVALNFDTNNGGKIANGNWTDWCQMNAGTTLTVPSCKNAVVSLEAYGDITTTTIDGQSDYAQGTTISYTVANTAETINVVIGDGSYYRYVKVVLPVVESAGGTSYTDEPASVYWESTSVENYNVAAPAPADVFSVTAMDLCDMTVSGAGKRASDPVTDFNFVKFKVSGSGNVVKYIVKPATGLTFTPTTLSFDCQRFGTDAENAVTVAMTNPDGQTISLGSWTAPRANKTQAEDKYGKNANYQQHIEIALTPEQQAALASQGELTVTIGVGVTASNKEGGLAHINLGGLINGTAVNVEKFALDVAASPAEGGNITVYPAADVYEAGSEVKLTATENFGYDFVNWIDAEGNTVSSEPVFTYTVSADAVLTANFAAVDTYELNYAVDGGANLYMVTPSPAPTVVDGKNMYEAGTNVSLVAASNPIVAFTNWSDGQTSGEIIVTMDENKDITANYSAVDFVAGWDFHLSGNNGRPADFASADNEAAALVLRDDAGETAGWLDKSAVGGGYEGRPGGVNWRQGAQNGDVGHYYFQTMVNAEAFTDIKVITASVYNYNSYQKYDLQYSLNGTDWTTVGSLNMAGAKSWTDLEATLPVAANNQKELYLRWYPDRESTIDGTASKNDGFCLGATYITGTAQLVDDGTAPVLVSTVPAEGAQNASANGKIVLTFDEKVKVAAGAKATIADQQLAPSVAGKVVTFEYKGLSYTTDYTFTLPAGSVMDLTDNVLNEAITINFSTKAKPEVAKALYDFVVPDDGNFREAIAAANSRADKSARFRIFIKQGAHVSPTEGTMNGTGDFTANTYPDPRVTLSTNNVSIIGEGIDNTSVTNVCPAAVGTTNPIEGLRNAYTLHNTGTGTYIQDLKLINGLKDGTGRGEAYEESGDKTILKNVGLWGYQDTYCSNNGRGRYYFEGGVIRGCTDYICGKDDVFFNGVEFRNVGNGGYIAVPSSPKQYGYIMRDCRITAEDLADNNGKYTLGRPWGKGTPIALWINTVCESVPSAAGWNEMSGGWPARFAEYNTTTASGTVIDLKGRKTIFADTHENNPILSADEAAFYTVTNVLGGDDDWDPTEATEQASAPSNVKIDENTGIMSWDNSNYALLWAVCENGKVVAFTTEPTYDTAGSTANFSVRAANEMGGLGEEAVAETVAVDLITTPGAEVVASVYYNVAGARVDADYEGVVIRVDTLADGTTVTTKYVNR